MYDVTSDGRDFEGEFFLIIRHFTDNKTHLLCTLSSGFDINIESKSLVDVVELDFKFMILKLREDFNSAVTLMMYFYLLNGKLRFSISMA